MDRKEMIARILQAKADKVYFLYDTFMLKDLEKIEEKKENIYKEYSAINTQNSELNLINNNYEKYINKNKDLDL